MITVDETGSYVGKDLGRIILTFLLRPASDPGIEEAFCRRGVIDSTVKRWWGEHKWDGSNTQFEIDGRGNSYICIRIMLSTRKDVRQPRVLLSCVVPPLARVPRGFGIVGPHLEISCHSCSPPEQSSPPSLMKYRAHVFEVLTIGTPSFSPSTKLRPYFCCCGLQLCKGSHDVVNCR